MKTPTRFSSRRLFPALLSVGTLLIPLNRLHGADLYMSGHADIGVGYEAGALNPHWHLHEGTEVNGVPLDAEVEYAPDGLLAYVPDPAIARPPGVQWDFLGTSTGSPLWFLPQAEDPGKPFLGIASEELIPNDWTSLNLTLVSFSGPAGGEFSLWQADLFGTPVVRMTTSDGIGPGDAFALTVGGHDHYNVGFTQPGEYAVTLQWDGVHQSDGPVTARATYGFTVQQVPEPGTATLLVLGALSWLTWGRSRGARCVR